MRRLQAILLLLGMFALGSVVMGQVIIGPEDDPYIMDTTGSGTVDKNLPFSGAASPTINSVNISQFDCSRFPEMCGYVEMRDSLELDTSGPMFRGRLNIRPDYNTVDDLAGYMQQGVLALQTSLQSGW